MITENTSTLKINKLSKKQYEREYQAGNIDPMSFYLVPDDEGSSFSSKDKSIELLLENWVLDEGTNTYTQTVSVLGLEEDSNPIIVLGSTEDEALDAYNCLTSDVVVANNTITFTAKELPTVTFTVIAKGSGGSSSGGAVDEELVAKVDELETDMAAVSGKVDANTADIVTNTTAISQLNSDMNNKVDTNDSRLSDARTPLAHTHDDRYYTETEMNTKLNAKQDVSTAINTSNIANQSVKYATSAGSANAVAWGNVSGKPSSFTPTSHNHNTLTSGTFSPTSSLSCSASNVSVYVNTAIGLCTVTGDVTIGSSKINAGDWFNLGTLSVIPKKNVYGLFGCLRSDGAAIITTSAANMIEIYINGNTLSTYIPFAKAAGTQGYVIPFHFSFYTA